MDLVTREAAQASLAAPPVQDPAVGIDRSAFYLYCRQQGLWLQEARLQRAPQARHPAASLAPMDRAETLALLGQHKPEMQRRFGVRSLALFGSRARGQSHAGSDFDMLVEFDGPATSARYFGLQFFLEDLLGGPVDLVTRQALRPQLRPFVERDVIHV